MRLPANGIEYAKWPVTGAPDGTALEARIVGTDTWRPLEWVTPYTEARLLLAGPTATDVPAEAMQVTTLGRSFVEIRLVDNPEVVIRSGGVIDVQP